MFRLFVFVLFLATVYSNELDTKIQMIWDDIDKNTTDGRVYIHEIQAFFSLMSTASGEVLYPTFDYQWGINYNDNMSVTWYIFNKWDVYPAGAPDHLLTVADLLNVYNSIETDQPDSIGFIDYFWEFHPYFVALYNGYTDASKRAGIVTLLG